jgi:23S rRNA pseudouridine1911/1915/1917 synthase
MDESEELSDEAAGEVVVEPEAETFTFEAAAEDEGARLDAFLAARIEGLSRMAVKRMADDGGVLVDGRPAKPSHRLSAGERVEAELPGAPVADLSPEEIPLDIIHEDAEVIVVNKPPGLVVHPAAGVRSGTLANALVFHFQNLSERGGTFRPGIVHRLDRDTSGLMVVAKTAPAHEKLSDQFRARTVFKSYVALVHGVVREEGGKIEQPLARDPRNRTRMAVVRGGREAVSVWKVRQRFTRFTLLDVRIRTGRTHQIRVHLAWMRHPVVGDETYGAGRDQSIMDPRLRARVAAIGRQFLHAERLAFDHPGTGERLMFEAPLPVDLAAFLDSLE